jgi:crotonobetainyl-CoA:carnitine CoA-transferase CaiB-like acyl-CoA transferase
VTGVQTCALPISWIGQTLADLGADLLKVESLDGNDTRTWGPPFDDHDGDRLAAYFHCANRGKRSIAVDFNSPERTDRQDRYFGQEF